MACAISMLQLKAGDAGDAESAFFFKASLEPKKIPIFSNPSCWSFSGNWDDLLIYYFPLFLQNDFKLLCQMVKNIALIGANYAILIANLFKRCLCASESLSFDPASSKLPHVLSGIIRAPCGDGDGFQLMRYTGILLSWRNNIHSMKHDQPTQNWISDSSKVTFKLEPWILCLYHSTYLSPPKPCEK